MISIPIAADAASVINYCLPEPQSSLLNGIVLGIPLGRQGMLYREIKEVGLLHMVVLSGSNIAILSSILSLSSRYFGRLISSMITILIIIAFVWFVGPEAPIVRAALMGILTHVAIITGKKYYAAMGLLVSLVIIAVFIPQWLETLSLQLSYAASAGLILFSPKAETVQSTSPAAKATRTARDCFLQSLAAQAFTAPFIFFRLKQFSLISPVANVFSAWTIAPLMVLGLSASLLGLLFRPLACVPAAIAYGLLTYLLTVIHWLSLVPFSYFQF